MTYNFIGIDRFAATNEKENTEYSDAWNFVGELNLNITSINNVTEYLFYDRYTVNGVVSFGSSYGVEDASSTIYSIGGMFYPDYNWDFEHNRTVLVDFGCFATYWYFIEPNWTYLNNHFATSFNESDIVDTVNDPYSSTIHNITLSDTLNETASFSIMGASTFPAITNEFSGNITRWTFEYDFSDKIYFGIYNSTLGANNYYPYETYTESLIIEYSVGGILKYYSHIKEVKWIEDDTTYYTYEEDIIEYGPMPDTTTSEGSGLQYFIAISTISTIVLIFKYNKKRD